MESDRFIGIMTGTSLDAIDLVQVNFEDGLAIEGFHSAPWPTPMRTLLRGFTQDELVSLDNLTRANFTLASLYAEAVEVLLQKTGIPKESVRAIGLHGQTIRHLPKQVSVSDDGITIGATNQLGSAPALAVLSGIDVVSDFRSADIALGGQGAPLVPIFDFAFLRSNEVSRLVTNLGGIANVTWLPRNASENDVLAFDTGPANIVLDGLANLYLQQDFDPEGENARRGTIDHTLLAQLLDHPYFSQPPPKSTGRELFGKTFLQVFSERIEQHGMPIEDAFATATELTARSIAEACTFLPSLTEEDKLQIVVSGGGARNTFLLERIQANKKNSSVIISDELGIPISQKEAIAFAFLAKANLDRLPVHLPRTTGASRKTTLGSLSHAK